MNLSNENNSLSPFLEDYLSSLSIEKNLSSNTISSYRTDLLLFINYLKSQKIDDFESVNNKIINSFFIQLSKLELASNSIARYHSSVNGFFNYLLLSDFITKNPVESVDKPKQKKQIPVVLSIQEMNQILEQPNTENSAGLRDRTILEVFYACGLRISELIGLKLSDLILDDEIIRVFGKRAKQRLVPIGSEARAFVSDYLVKSRPFFEKKGKSFNFLFLNNRGTHFSRMGIWKIVSKYVVMADIKKEVHPHTFRHTFATHLIEGGADLRAVQEMLGHADISTTQIYTHIDNSFIKQEHRLYHPRG